MVWRANYRLKEKPFFLSFMHDLWDWTHEPLEDFHHHIPVFREDEADEVDEDEDEGTEDDCNDGDWFIPSEEVDESDL